MTGRVKKLKREDGVVCGLLKKMRKVMKKKKRLMRNDLIRLFENKKVITKQIQTI